MGHLKSHVKCDGVSVLHQLPSSLIFQKLKAQCKGHWFRKFAQVVLLQHTSWAAVVSTGKVSTGKG